MLNFPISRHTKADSMFSDFSKVEVDKFSHRAEWNVHFVLISWKLLENTTDNVTLIEFEFFV